MKVKAFSNGNGLRTVAVYHVGYHIIVGALRAAQQSLACTLMALIISKWAVEALQRGGGSGVRAPIWILASTRRLLHAYSMAKHACMHLQSNGHLSLPFAFTQKMVVRMACKLPTRHRSSKTTTMMHLDTRQPVSILQACYSCNMLARGTDSCLQWCRKVAAFLQAGQGMSVAGSRQMPQP